MTMNIQCQQNGKHQNECGAKLFHCQKQKWTASAPYNQSLLNWLKPLHFSSIWHPHSADISDTSFQIQSSQCSLSRNAPSILVHLCKLACLQSFRMEHKHHTTGLTQIFSCWQEWGSLWTHGNMFPKEWQKWGIWCLLWVLFVLSQSLVSMNSHLWFALLN